MGGGTLISQGLGEAGIGWGKGGTGWGKGGGRDASRERGKGGTARGRGEEEDERIKKKRRKKVGEGRSLGLELRPANTVATTRHDHRPRAVN